MVTPAGQRPTVFISYAHENEALRSSVKALADWLVNQGCNVLTDHAYQYRPPDVGWQAWMLGCIDKAETVLVVCTPKLKLRYEKNAPPDTGQGATYEGAIVTQHLYDNAMRNTKFFPILPEDGREDDIPRTLKSWWNGHRFPSGNNGIRRMIFAETAGPDADQTSRPPTESHHVRMAVRLLKAVEHSWFVHALQKELAERFYPDAAPQTHDETVQRFSECSPEEDKVLKLFFSVRAALDHVPAEIDTSRRSQCEEAAAALYCIAACCLVKMAAHAAGINYVISVPSSEPVICAVIATALFGGELRLLAAEQDDLPTAEYVFKLKVPEGGDRLVDDFERAAYVALFANDRETPEISSADGPLSRDQRERLAARLRTIKHVRRASLAFVIRGDVSAPAFQAFGTAHQAPVMVPESEATTELLGMDVKMLLAEIREFWAELKVLTGHTKPAFQQSSFSTTPGAGTMPSSGPIFNIGNLSGGLAYGTASHSAVQAGASHAAHIDHRQGADLATLIPLLQELAQEVGNLTSAEQRERLTDHIELAQHEASKKNNPDPGRIKRALDLVKSGAEGLEHGGKIIALCNKAYNVIALLLGTPPSPLP